MLSREILGIIAIIISAASDLFYIVSVLRGDSKPHVFTWIIWSIVASIVFIAQISHNAGPGAWVTGFFFCSLLFYCFWIGIIQRRKAYYKK